MSDEDTRAEAPTDHARVLALDGLRGLAILLVMFFHLTFVTDEGFAEIILYRVVRNWFWCTIDLFFVLSGFLITGILCDARERTRYFRNFYARRTLRVFPLYYIYLTLFFLVALFFAPVRSLVGGDGIYFWIYLQNFATASAGDWAHSNFLDLFWSLAVEEQFYLAWPLVVLALRRRPLMFFCVGLMAFSSVLRITLFFVYDVPPVALYVMTPTRLEGLAAGAFIAAFVRGPGGTAGLVVPAKMVLWASTMGLAAVGWQQSGFFYYRLPLSVTFGLTLLSFFWGSLLVLALAASPRGLYGRVLESRFLRIFGKYSYALYIIHSTVYMGFVWLLRRYMLDGRSDDALLVQLLMYAVVIPVAFVIAAGSWRFIESPILNLKRFFPRDTPPR